MSKPPKTVFISCGQHTDEERDLGKRACELVKQCTPFEGYFAQNQTTLKSLAENVLSRLYESVGFIAIMHHRGKIESRDVIRASVWIEQEVAMATLMEQVLKRPLHVALFAERGIAIEGIRQQIQFNPVYFTKSDEVVAQLRETLPTWKEPLYEGLTPDQREAIRRKVSVVRINALHPRLTLWLTNRSDWSIWVKSVSLWHGQKRLSNGALYEGKPREVQPQAENAGTVFTTDEDAAQKLQDLGIVDKHLPNYQFSERADIEVRIEYDVLGQEDEHRETLGVKVLGRQIDLV